MKSRDKIFFWVCVGVLGLSLFVTFWKFFVLRDYTVILQIPCDPNQETCFVAQCDPADMECADATEQEPVYYKRLEKIASRIPECGPHEYCPPLGCVTDEENCREILCAPDTLVEGEACSESVVSTPVDGDAPSLPAEEAESSSEEAVTSEGIE